MANYCFVTPILPGAEAKMQEWIQSKILSNADHDAVFGAAGISREQVWIQPTPMGTFAVVSFEVEDPARAFGSLATSSTPWAGEFRAFMKSAHGVDITQPVPPNTQVLNWYA